MAGSEHGDAGSGDEDAGSAASLEDGDFDKYLAELSNNSGGGDAGSGGGSDAGKACTLGICSMPVLCAMR
jgi:hypothetical protein